MKTAAGDLLGAPAAVSVMEFLSCSLGIQAAIFIAAAGQKKGHRTAYLRDGILYPFGDQPATLSFRVFPGLNEGTQASLIVTSSPV